MPLTNPPPAPQSDRKTVVLGVVVWGMTTGITVLAKLVGGLSFLDALLYVALPGMALALVGAAAWFVRESCRHRSQAARAIDLIVTTLREHEAAMRDLASSIQAVAAARPLPMSDEQKATISDWFKRHPLD